MNRFAGSKGPAGGSLSKILSASRSIAAAELSHEADRTALQAGEALQRVPLALIDPSPYQARRSFDSAALQDLARSLRADGQQVPVKARPVSGRFELVYGERRWRAAQLAQLDDLLVIVADVPDDEARLIGLLENLMREGLNPLDEVDAKLAIAAEVLGIPAVDGAAGWTQVQARLRSLRKHPEQDHAAVAALTEAFAQLGAESWESFAAGKMNLVNLAEPMRTHVREGNLEYTKALLIARAPAEHHEALCLAALGGLTVQALRTQIAQLRPEQPAATLGERVSKLRPFLSGRKLTALDAPTRTRVETLITEIEALVAGDTGGRARRGRQGK